MLDVVQRGGANLQAFLVFVVPLRDARVQIPAVVVEARRVGDAADVVEVLAFELAEPDDHVGDLDARVVDVVLHFDRNAAESLHAHERVAERGVPKVADVRGLVRIDGRVLDDGLSGSDRPYRVRGSDPNGTIFATKRHAIQVDIQVPVRRGLDAAMPSIGPERGGELLRDRARRLAQPARQLEGDRRREVAELALGRILDRQLRQRVRRKLIQLAGALPAAVPAGVREVEES